MDEIDQEKHISSSLWTYFSDALADEGRSVCRKTVKTIVLLDLNSGPIEFFAFNTKLPDTSYMVILRIL